MNKKQRAALEAWKLQEFWISLENGSWKRKSDSWDSSPSFSRSREVRDAIWDYRQQIFVVYDLFGMPIRRRV